MSAKLSFLIFFCFFAEAFAQWSYEFGHQQQQQQQAATEFGGFGPWPSKYGLGQQQQQQGSAIGIPGVYNGFGQQQQQQQQQQQMAGSFGYPIGVYPSWYSPGFSPAIRANEYPIGSGLNRLAAAQLRHPWTGSGGYSAAYPLTAGIGVGGNFGGIGLEGGFGGIGYGAYPLNYGVGAYGYPIGFGLNRMTAASLGNPWTGLGGYSTGYPLEAGLGFGGVGLGAEAFATDLTGRFAAAQLPYCSEIDRIKAKNGIGAMGTGQNRLTGNPAGPGGYPLCYGYGVGNFGGQSGLSLRAGLGLNSIGSSVTVIPATTTVVMTPVVASNPVVFDTEYLGTGFGGFGFGEGFAGGFGTGLRFGGLEAIF